MIEAEPDPELRLRKRMEAARLSERVGGLLQELHLAQDSGADTEAIARELSAALRALSEHLFSR